LLLAARYPFPADKKLNARRRRIIFLDMMKLFFMVEIVSVLVCSE